MGLPKGGEHPVGNFSISSGVHPRSRYEIDDKHGFSILRFSDLSTLGLFVSATFGLVLFAVCGCRAGILGNKSRSGQTTVSIFG